VFFHPETAAFWLNLSDTSVYAASRFCQIRECVKAVWKTTELELNV
jgi:hypothetical protein